MEEREYIIRQKEQANSNKEMINHPAHYNINGMECIDVMESLFGIDWTYHFCVLNAFKYQFRFNNKGKAQEDLRKAAWYNTKAAELLGKMEGNSNG